MRSWVQAFRGARTDGGSKMGNVPHGFAPARPERERPRGRVLALLLAVFFAALCAAGPLALPFEGAPVTLTTLVLVLAGYLLGPWWGLLPLGAWLALGAAGAPVFSGAAGGLGILLGPTGGYAVFGACIVVLTGLGTVLFSNILLQFATALAGHVLYYVGGVVWYMAETHALLVVALLFGVLSFLVSDLIKAAIGVAAGFFLKKWLFRRKGWAR